MPIGGPLSNLNCYVLDAHLQLVPVGVPGELMASGIQVARGYIKRPDLTAEKFVPNPYSGGRLHHDRLYRTGAANNHCSVHTMMRRFLSRQASSPFSALVKQGVKMML